MENLTVVQKNIFSELSNIINKVSGIDISQEENPNVNFFELGLDSLMVVRIGQGIEKVFGLEMKVSQFYEEASTINQLVAYLEQHLPSDWVTPVVEPVASQTVKIPAQIAMPVISDKTNNREVHQSAVERIMSHQLRTMSQLMSQQLELLKNSGGHRVPQPEAIESVADKSTVSEKSEKAVSQNIRSIEFKPEKLTPKQAQFIKDFIARYTERTKKSKAFVQNTRSVFSDWINSLGFRLSLKEIKYPIVASKALGSKIWDIDGNEYIDIAIGYGVSYFGNRAPFIVKAIEEQLHEGFELGPQTPIGAEVAQLIHELTGVERVTFCNTGSEAVMFALRIARTVTNRKKIVMFAGSYHGNSDGVLAAQGENTTLPVAPGIPENMVENVLVLNYGTPETLATIEAHAHELAAVLVEPVQSRRPGFQPKEFLQKLRELTAKTGIVLIFDEMITGFRIHPGGAQAWFEVQADLVTYGKIVGGGMPIGVIAGKAKYMNAIDGGLWQFGDDSSPNQTVTFFAGTFCKHPLSMVAARAVLRHLKEQGSALQTQVNERTARFARHLNDFFKTENVAIRVAHFGSLFRFESFGKYHQLLEPVEMVLLFYLLMEKGVYAWERYICFFSTAHTDEEIDSIIQAVKDSIQELRAGGFTLESAPPEVQTYPMSSAQKRLFVLNELDGEQSSYQTPKAFIVEGELNIQKLEQCFAEVVNRHDSLRTTFAVQADGEMIQQVHAHVDFNVFYQESTEKKVDDIVKDFIQPFDLTKAPIMRVGVVKLSTHRYILLFDTHHIVLDGLSTNILVQEFTQLYQGKTLPSVTKQYKDYGAWQQTQLATDQFVKQETYWIEKFSGSIPVIDLPTDYPRPKTLSSKGQILYSSVSKEDTSRLKSLASQTGVTLNMLLLAIYNVWLHRLTRQTDIIIGFPVSGRPPGFEHTLGMFANTLAIRNKPHSNLFFTDFLKMVKSSLLHDYDHQDYPFENLVNKLNLQRDVSRNALFDVMFTYEFANDRVFGIKELSFTPYDLKIETSGFDLDVEAIEQKGRISLSCAYATALFQPETIKRWFGYFEKIIQEILNNPNQRLGEIDILAAAEKHRLLVEFNDTEADYPRDQTILDLIEAQVKKQPDNIAVIFENIHLTYRQLNERANQIAYYLQKAHSIQPENKVALALERSEWMVIGVLGILKAGGAYVPVDTSYPIERIRYLLQDSGCQLVLTSATQIKTLQAFVGNQVSIIDIQSIQTAETENPISTRCPQHLAYVIYTSGSTGWPKGVMVEHKELVNAAYAWRRYYKLDEFEVKLLQMASLSFDVFAGDFIRALTNGGQMIICPSNVRLEPPLLCKLMAKHGINIFESTPSLIVSLMDYISANHLDFSFLKAMVTSSDTLQVEHYQALLNQFGAHTQVVNCYGVTEATIDSSNFEETGVARFSETNTPIGKPLQNIQYYVLDSAHRLLPIGIPGELYIGGACVTRGYINKETLTAERFVPNPFKPGERLYKTGDLVRWLPDGNMAFWGRIDNQVQIRGYRIECEEIENQLLQHPSVKETVVLAKTDDSHDKQLVAYVVGFAEADLTAENLKDYLSSSLPDYMIPVYFVFLDKFPLTPNAKIDRKALPDPDKTDIKTVYEAPRNEMEKKVGKIWENVLSQEKIGIHDNFFDLGGHSIKAMHVISKIHTELKAELKLEDIFIAPTIAKLAVRLKTDATTPLTPIEVLPPQPYYEVSNAQKRLWLVEQMVDNPIVYNMHVAYLLSGEVNVVSLQKALETIVFRHESLRTIFTVVVGELKQKILQNIDFKLDIVDLTNVDDPEEQARQYYRQEAGTPFDLQTGPLFRAQLLKLSWSVDEGKRYVLIINAHHIIFDGWSTDILFREISELYQSYCRNQTPALLPLRIQYKDYATWLNKLLASEAIKPHRDYWLGQFSGELPILNFPLDYPRPEVQRFHGKMLWFSIEDALVEELRQLSIHYEATLFMTLLSAITVCLYYYTSQRDIIVGIPSAARVHPDLENQVGFYLNMLALRTTLDSNDTLLNVLEKVKTATIEAYQHEIYPYDSLVEDLHLEKNTNRHHLFDVIVNLASFEQYDITMDNVQLTTFLEESQTSRSDFQFYFSEEQHLRLAIEYDTDLFKEETVRKVADNLTALLQRFVKNIHTPLKEVKNVLLTRKEKVEQQDFLQAAMNIDEDF
jgi:glutamate-1-semialdehyde-2,1-aminomutase